MIYNIKSHKKPGFHPLFKRYSFRKTTGGGGGGRVQTEVKRKIGGVMKPDYKTAKDTLINLWWVVCHSAKNFSKWLLFHERNRINEKVLFSPLTPACYFWLFFEICFLHMMKISLFPSSVCTLIDPEKE